MPLTYAPALPASQSIVPLTSSSEPSLPAGMVLTPKPAVAPTCPSVISPTPRQRRHYFTTEDLLTYSGRYRDTAHST